jgi:hypothetical protein
LKEVGVDEKGNKKRVEKKQNMIFIFIRRKFIPIFYDTYVDIVAIISEDYDDAKEIEISSECSNIIETLSDSIFGNDCLEHENKRSEKLNSILEAKIDSLQIDAESIEYFYQVLGLRGNLYNFGLEYVYKLALLLDQYVRDRFTDIKKYLERKINIYHKAHDKYFDIEYTVLNLLGLILKMSE